MSITDELREYVSHYSVAGSTKDKLLTAIADCIDAEHEAQLNDAFETRNSDENLESDGWVRLPKDVDGEYIHVGDLMEGVDKYDSLKKVKGKVITVSFESDGAVDVAVQAWSSDGKSWHRAYLDPDASIYRHYHEPTVEDVLREMVAAYMDTPLDDSNDDEFFAEYAAKLRLAGDGA